MPDDSMEPATFSDLVPGGIQRLAHHLGDLMIRRCDACNIQHDLNEEQLSQYMLKGCPPCKKCQGKTKMYRKDELRY